MCIIVAKNAKVAMPTEEILRTCFKNNPDGAGFMLASKGKVFGFKGLMTADELITELAKAEKRFGNLDKLPVVIHCRIKTHGETCQGNTHPFPLDCGYREMRKTEWVARQGFAHNGIIYAYDRDADIKNLNVSDTMVFAKKAASPIAHYADIASDPALLDFLFAVANSKLCFLSGKGKLATRGEFTEQNGVLYSNTSFREARVKTAKLADKWSYEPYAGWNYDDAWDCKSGYGGYCFSLSQSEKEDLRKEIEEYEGMTRYGRINVWCNDGDNLIPIPEHDLSVDADGVLYEWDDIEMQFVPLYLPDEYFYIEEKDDEKGGDD